MLRLRDSQVELFDAVMPPEAKVLSKELAAVDALLDDDRFLAPFVARFACPIGRPTIPIETYLRLMYSSTATAWATRRWSRRWPTRSPGAGSAGSV